VEEDATFGLLKDGIPPPPFFYLTNTVLPCPFLISFGIWQQVEMII
jgi:hypothetical protein